MEHVKGVHLETRPRLLILTARPGLRECLVHSNICGPMSVTSIKGSL